jgi:uncharacterized protein
MRRREESLTRLQTDTSTSDRCTRWFTTTTEKCYVPEGVLEALTAAKQQGKVRVLGFTCHKNPSHHLDALNRGYKFDAVSFRSIRLIRVSARLRRTCFQLWRGRLCSE